MKTIKDKQQPIEAWHFLPDNGRMRYEDNRKPVVGKVYRANGELNLCNNGMHASLDIMDALSFAPGSLLCRVEIIPPFLSGDEKLCGRGRRILWKTDATKLLHEFACRCAVRALKKANVTDTRCWDAIKVKRLWLAGKATDAELSAYASAYAAYAYASAYAYAYAYASAASAAYSASASAASAAYAYAAYSASASAASAASASAASAAYAYAASARKAERDWQRKTLLRMIERTRKQIEQQ